MCCSRFLETVLQKGARTSLRHRAAVCLLSSIIFLIFCQESLMMNTAFTLHQRPPKWSYTSSIPPPPKSVPICKNCSCELSLKENSDKPQRGSSSPHHLHAVGIKMFLAAAPEYFQRPTFFYAVMFIKSGRSSCLLKARYVRFVII